MRASSMIALVLLASCTAKGKATVTEEAFENRERRHELMEATFRVLDKHPAYVDEMFAIAQRHPRSLERMFANTARDLAKQELAERVAKHLAAHPAGLRQIMIETLDASKGNAAAEKAIIDALEARPGRARTLSKKFAKDLIDF
jgi:hypothetical protein